VVTGVAEPEDEESVELELLEEPAEPEVPEEPEAPEAPEPDATGAVVVDACVVVVVLRASAGSWPETSWRKIPPVLARKIAVATPTTRRRM
jgi:hypothetical protein